MPRVPSFGLPPPLPNYKQYAPKKESGAGTTAAPRPVPAAGSSVSSFAERQQQWKHTKQIKKEKIQESVRAKEDEVCTFQPNVHADDILAYNARKRAMNKSLSTSLLTSSSRNDPVQHQHHQHQIPFYALPTESLHLRTEEIAKDHTYSNIAGVASFSSPMRASPPNLRHALSSSPAPSSSSSVKNSRKKGATSTTTSFQKMTAACSAVTGSVDDDVTRAWAATEASLSQKLQEADTIAEQGIALAEKLLQRLDILTLQVEKKKQEEVEELEHSLNQSIEHARKHRVSSAIAAVDTALRNRKITHQPRLPLQQQQRQQGAGDGEEDTDILEMNHHLSPSSKSSVPFLLTPPRAVGNGAELRKDESIYKNVLDTLAASANTSTSSALPQSTSHLSAAAAAAVTGSTFTSSSSSSLLSPSLLEPLLRAPGTPPRPVFPSAYNTFTSSSPLSTSGAIAAASIASSYTLPTTMSHYTSTNVTNNNVNNHNNNNPSHTPSRSPVQILIEAASHLPEVYLQSVLESSEKLNNSLRRLSAITGTPQRDRRGIASGGDDGDGGGGQNEDDDDDDTK